MGSITRSFANNITTSGVLLPASLTNNSIANVTAYNAAIATGNMVLISSQTASASASISFTTGIDSTYKEYQFYFINIHPSINDTRLMFNGSTDGGSNYNVTKTSTAFYALHSENDVSTSLTYQTALDLAQSTDFQTITNSIGNDNDQSACAVLTLFNPSSTTYVKHFTVVADTCDESDTQINHYFAGYFNTTSAINAIQFKMFSGNIDDGTILMFGIK
jgi:hypothetical protein